MATLNVSTSARIPAIRIRKARTTRHGTHSLVAPHALQHPPHHKPRTCTSLSPLSRRCLQAHSTTHRSIDHGPRHTGRKAHRWDDHRRFSDSAGVIPVSIPVIPVIRTRIQVMASPCLGRCQRQPAHRCAPPLPLCAPRRRHCARCSTVGRVRRRRLRIGGHLTCAVPSTTTWSSCRPPPRPCSSGTCWYGPLWPLSTVEHCRVL
jgi:hypothetical protein